MFKYGYSNVTFPFPLTHSYRRRGHVGVVGGGGGVGIQQSFMRGGSAPVSNP